ncbi:hypothetical protein BKA80DRAFT_23320 [Phyllosticta citrichinensis]
MSNRQSLQEVSRDNCHEPVNDRVCVPLQIFHVVSLGSTLLQLLDCWVFDLLLDQILDLPIAYRRDLFAHLLRTGVVRGQLELPDEFVRENIFANHFLLRPAERLVINLEICLSFWRIAEKRQNKGTARDKLRGREAEEGTEVLFPYISFRLLSRSIKCRFARAERRQRVYVVDAHQRESHVGGVRRQHLLVEALRRHCREGAYAVLLSILFNFFHILRRRSKVVLRPIVQKDLNALRVRKRAQCSGD